MKPTFLKARMCMYNGMHCGGVNEVVRSSNKLYNSEQIIYFVIASMASSFNSWLTLYGLPQSCRVAVIVSLISSCHSLKSQSIRACNTRQWVQRKPLLHTVQSCHNF